MSFAMPSGFNLSNLPVPNDNSIKIDYIEKQKFIVIRFSGFASDSNFQEYEEVLVKQIKAAKINVDLTTSIRAYYDKPWTLPFWKRNELLFKLTTS